MAYWKFCVEFAELNEDQRRRLVDVRQLYDAWRLADAELRHGYRGTMRWREVSGGACTILPARWSGRSGRAVR